MTFPVEKVRADFPVLTREVNGLPLAYLDSAASAQKPNQVVDAEAEFYRHGYAAVHRGIHTLSAEATQRMENVRTQVAAFLNARSPEELVFVRGTTEGINLVANSWGNAQVHAGDNIIITQMEHHANIVPWQMLAERKGAEIRVLPFDDEGRLCTELLPSLLDDKTRIVAVTQASNTLGTRPDLRPVIDAAHAVGAIAVVDGCQGVVHGGVDVQALDCDFYAFSGHKLFGPTGIGVLYGKRALLEAMPPFLGGGDMVDTVTFAKTTYAPVPGHRPGRSREIRRAFRPGRGRGARGGAAAPCDRTAFGRRRAADLRYDARQVCHRVVQRRGCASLRHVHDPRQAGHRRPYRAALCRTHHDAFLHDGDVPRFVRALQYAGRGRCAGRRRGTRGADAARIAGRATY